MIAIIAVLASVAIPYFITSINHSRQVVDIANLRILNNATRMYKADKFGFTEESVLFVGLPNDTQKIELLVSEGFLNEPVSAKASDAEFVWDSEGQIWLYRIDGLISGTPSIFIFKDLDTSDFRSAAGAWTNNSEGFYSTQGLIFIENSKSEYTLKSNATLDAGSSYGGYALLFETRLNEQNQDTGYALQFDRGFSEIIIRPRTNGGEASPIVRIGNVSTSTVKTSLIPSSARNSWWTQPHEIALTVTEVEGQEGKKTVTVSIDNQVVLSNFMVNSTVDPIDNYTGFRTWSSVGATFESLVIE